MFERLLLPATWLCQMLRGKTAGVSCPPPAAALRLLTSSVATAAKAAQLTGISTIVSFSDFTYLLDLWKASAVTGTAAGGMLYPVCPPDLPAIATLLLLRIVPAVAMLPEGPPKFFASIWTLDFAVKLSEAADRGGGLHKPPSSCARSASVLHMLSSCHVSALPLQLVAQLTAGAAGHTPIVPTLEGRIVHVAVGALSNYVGMLV